MARQPVRGLEPVLQPAQQRRAGLERGVDVDRARSPLEDHQPGQEPETRLPADPLRVEPGGRLGDLRPVAGGPVLALGDGEDFEILIAVAPNSVPALLGEWPFIDVPLTCIGGLVPAGEGASLTGGWEHFNL